MGGWVRMGACGHRAQHNGEGSRRVRGGRQARLFAGSSDVGAYSLAGSWEEVKYAGLETRLTICN
jgi:hypothetical protein